MLSPITGLPFHPVHSALRCTKVFNSDVVQRTYLLFCCLHIGSHTLAQAIQRHQIFILRCFVIVSAHMLILDSFWVWFNTWQRGPPGSTAHGDNSPTAWWKDWLFHWSSRYSCQKQSIIYSRATSFVWGLEINGYNFLLNAYGSLKCTSNHLYHLTEAFISSSVLGRSFYVCRRTTL